MDVILRRKSRSSINDTLLTPLILSQHLLLNKECGEKIVNYMKSSENESIRSWGKDTLPFGVLNRSASKRASKVSRLVQKNGDCNVSQINVPSKERQYMRDIFTTLIDVPWRYILIIFASGFVISWTLFALIYYAICYLHNDFELNRRIFGLGGFLSKETVGRKSFINKVFGNNSSRTASGSKPSDIYDEPCIANVHDFVSIFLFSVESQHTIGYGNRYTTTSCSSAIATLCIQSICGLLIQSFMAGLVFAKLAGPKKRAMTLIFSKNACVTLRDGLLCFLLRVGDMRNTHLVEAHLRLQLIRRRVTAEGEILPLQKYDMDIGFQEGQDRIFLVWPITVCHVIDKTSPLYEYASEDLAIAQFEIIVLLEGIVESTGMTAQARTSYLPNEIFWGHRFEKLITYQKQNGDYQIDYSRFHKTMPVSTPTCSAKELDLIKMSGCNIASQYYDVDDDDTQESESVTPCSMISSQKSFDYSSDAELVQVVSSSDDSAICVGKCNPMMPKFLAPCTKRQRTRFPFSTTSSSNDVVDDPYTLHPPKIRNVVGLKSPFYRRRQKMPSYSRSESEDTMIASTATNRRPVLVVDDDGGDATPSPNDSMASSELTAMLERRRTPEILVISPSNSSLLGLNP